MSAGNTHRSYGSVTKMFHWLTALLILTAIPLGLIASNLAHEIKEHGIDPELMHRTAILFSLHKTIGVAAFFTALLRILWALRQPRPGLLNADHKIEAFLAELIHWALYGAMLIVPLSGWLHHAATAGFAPILWPFGQSLPLVPQSETVAHFFGSIHWLATKILFASLLLHVVGGLKHALIDRDATMARMMPGKRDLPTPPEASHSQLPMVGALAIWAAALGYTTLNAPPSDHGAAMPEMAEVASDWQVQEGTLAISVQQMGSAVAGEFASWTAAITFDEPQAPGPAGAVEVTIAIPSLTLGSVTDQALGSDYLAASDFPTAVFKGDIVKTETGYAVSGPLTIREATVDIAFPFDLTFEGDSATMTGQVILQRLDFGVGTSQPDGSSLGLEVAVNIALTATRAQN